MILPHHGCVLESTEDRQGLGRPHWPWNQGVLCFVFAVLCFSPAACIRSRNAVGQSTLHAQLPMLRVISHDHDDVDASYCGGGGDDDDDCGQSFQSDIDVVVSKCEALPVDPSHAVRLRTYVVVTASSLRDWVYFCVGWRRYEHCSCASSCIHVCITTQNRECSTVVSTRTL